MDGGLAWVWPSYLNSHPSPLYPSLPPLSDVAVSEVWSCGSCLLDGSTTAVFPCHNSGGEGSFRLLLDEERKRDGQDPELASTLRMVSLIDPANTGPTNQLPYIGFYMYINHAGRA